MADVRVVVRYRRAVSLRAARPAGRAGDGRYGLRGAAGRDGRDCAELIAASPVGVTLVLWSFYSPDAGAMAAELAAVRAAAPESACACRKLRPCHGKPIFVDQPSDPGVPPDAVVRKIGRFGQRFQRRGAAQEAMRPVLIMVGLVIA